MRDELGAGEEKQDYKEISMKDDGKGGEIIYIRPMHPQVRKNEPGRCPACGMELIPSAAKAMASKPEKKTDGHGGHDMQKCLSLSGTEGSHTPTMRIATTNPADRASNGVEI